MKVQHKRNILRGMILKNIQASTFHMRQKSNNKNYDYIANSQCCGLYSYGKRSKESKLRKLIPPSETDKHRGQKVLVFSRFTRYPRALFLGELVDGRLTALTCILTSEY